jgi:hypothetical protein
MLLTPSAPVHVTIACVGAPTGFLCGAVEEAENKAAKVKKKKKNMAMSFGWEVFNADAKYRAYKRRLSALPGQRSVRGRSPVFWAGRLQRSAWAFWMPLYASCFC